MDLDGLLIQAQTLFLGDEELLGHQALVALELDHFSEVRVARVDDGAIAREFLLDDTQNLFWVEFDRQALDGSQGLAAIALCAWSADRTPWGAVVPRTLDANVNVRLGLLGLAIVLIGFGERIDDLEILDRWLSDIPLHLVGSFLGVCSDAVNDSP